MLSMKPKSKAAVKLSITETLMTAAINDNKMVKAFLVNGIKLETPIEGFSDKVIVGRTQNGEAQLIYRHALSTIGSTNTKSRQKPMEGLEQANVENCLLENFEGELITAYLLSGIKLSGDLLGYDEGNILISSQNGGNNVIMKPAIATIVFG